MIDLDFASSCKVGARPRNFQDPVICSGAVVSAWAWVHSGNQFGFRGKRQRTSRSGDRYFAVLERLAHDFERRPMKFPEFIQK